MFPEGIGCVQCRGQRRAWGLGPGELKSVGLVDKRQASLPLVEEQNFHLRRNGPPLRVPSRG